MTTITLIGPGAVGLTVGAALLDAGHRVSSCTSLSRCILAVLLPQRLDELMLIEPRLAAALLASIGKRLSLRLRHVSARLGAALSAD